MRLIKQEVYILDSNYDFKAIEELKAIEYAARNCYASQSKMTEDSYKTFIANLIKRGHTAPLEFGRMTVELVTSRAVLAEITRHRHASFCVESQRYIKENATGDIEFIEPTWFNDEDKEESKIALLKSLKQCELSYDELMNNGCAAQEAREILPNSTACKIVMSANLREWRAIFGLRCAKNAYPQIRELMCELLELAHETYPVVFDDLYDEFINTH